MSEQICLPSARNKLYTSKPQINLNLQEGPYDQRNKPLLPSLNARQHRQLCFAWYEYECCYTSDPSSLSQAALFVDLRRCMHLGCMSTMLIFVLLKRLRGTPKGSLHQCCMNVQI